MGLDPPRLEPFGAYGDPHLGRVQMDEYPLFPNILYNGGTRTNLAACSTSGCPNGYRPSSGSGPLQDGMKTRAGLYRTISRGPKVGTTSSSGSSRSGTLSPSPAPIEYTGVSNFGRDADNPLSTGNGYANALIGAFTTYTELSNRIDAEAAHWQSDGYAQDSWRITPRVTLDYGLRVTHHGAIYETRNQNSAFDPTLWNRAQAPELYQHMFDARPRQSTVRNSEPKGNKPKYRRDRVASVCGQHRTGFRLNNERHVRRGPDGRETGMVLRHARSFVGTAPWCRVGRNRRWKDRHPRRGRHLLQFHQPQSISLHWRSVDCQQQGHPQRGN